MDPEARLLHQVHPVKLGADVAASALSNVLLWRHRPVPGLLVRVLVPLAASAAVLRLADVDGLRSRAAGRYVLAHMPPAAEALRLAGDATMAVGAWRRRPAVMATGLAVVAAGWSHGLLAVRGSR